MFDELAAQCGSRAALLTLARLIVQFMLRNL